MQLLSGFPLLVKLSAPPVDTTGMEREDLLFISIAFGVSICVTLLIVVGLSAWLRLRWRSNPARVEAEDALAELSFEIDSVRQKYSVLSAYTTEYFNTFLNAGWDDLRLFLEDLEIVENSLRFMLVQERYRDVSDISRFLLGSLPPAHADDLVRRFSGLEELSTWKKECHDILVRIIQSSEVSAQKTAAIGIYRKRAVKPTLVTLAELRKDLNDDKEAR